SRSRWGRRLRRSRPAPQSSRGREPPRPAGHRPPKPGRTPSTRDGIPPWRPAALLHELTRPPSASSLFLGPHHTERLAPNERALSVAMYPALTAGRAPNFESNRIALTS